MLSKTHKKSSVIGSATARAVHVFSRPSEHVQREKEMKRKKKKKKETKRRKKGQRKVEERARVGSYM
jgi:hypothetical protein